MTRAALVACAFAGATALGLHAAQEPTFRTAVDVIRVDVLVLDGARPVAGLSARDFEVRDNGVPQRVQVDSLEDAPLDVVLALDTSSSVGGRLLTQLTAAADALVAALDSRDRVALLTFSSSLALRAPLTSDRARVRRAIAGVRASGSTSVVDALSAAISLPGASGRPTLLLVFSDGLDTASWQAPSQVLDQARRSDVVIDGVVVGGGQPELPGRPAANADADDIRRFLPRATAATGGRLLDGSRGERLSGAFIEALRSFRERYEITYSPEGPQAFGWHAIEVRVKGRRTLTIRARPGYLR
jgi:VWFA-related protein